VPVTGGTGLTGLHCISATSLRRFHGELPALAAYRRRQRRSVVALPSGSVVGANLMRTTVPALGHGVRGGGDAESVRLDCRADGASAVRTGSG
jgi:hypothetical protein